jgi:predicted outer membrane repeat protein
MWQVANLRILRTILFWLLVAVLCPLARGKIVYVDDDAVGANTGTSWTDAYRYLQDALSASQSGDEIRVAQGIYRPDQASARPTVPGRTRRSTLAANSSVDGRTATFELKNGVTIKGEYGGGGASDPDAQDAELYVTVLSGDLAGDDGPDFANRAENCYHVVTGSGVDATAVLDHVAITGGNASGSLRDGSGGGMYLEHSSPTLTHCAFRDNMAHPDGSSAVLSGGEGGGVYNLGGSPQLAHCTFNGNSARSGGGLYDGGEGEATLADCTFRGNSASEAGGGICAIKSSARIETSTIANNSASQGGGIACETMSPWIANCVITDNSAVYGGAIHCIGCSPRIVNDTIVRNFASGYGGGGIYCGNASPTVVNTILWNNAPDEIYLKASPITVAHSAVQVEGRLPWPGVGNINAAPLFVNAEGTDGKTGTEDDNLRLLPSSPCVNAGDNAVILPSSVDRDGNPRIIDETVDIGAYESGPVSRPVLYYVDATQGNDGNNGSSPETAFATIRRAVETARDGDTVLVYPGLYTAEVDFLGKAVLVKGVATKAGVPVLENSRGFAVSFYRGEGPDSVLANFVIRNSFIGVFVAGSSPTIRNITLVDNDSGVEAYVGAEPDIANCIFWGNTETDLFQCEARYSCLGLSEGGQHNISADPLFVDPDNGDYHLRSERGRYWPEHDVWVLDELTSPCVDGGDPNTPAGQERMPNGGRINMGAYGGTPYASMSDIPCPCDGGGNQPPHVRINEPADGASLYFAYTVGIVAEAGDADGHVVKVEFFANGQKIGEDIEGDDGWTMDWTDHYTGEYELVARATDDDNASTESAPVRVTMGPGSRGSSRRYKTCIEDLQIDQKEVLRLRPVRFQWRTTGQADVGLIAEDVAERLPDLVIYDGEGRPDGVQYEKLSVYLLGIIQMQQDRLAALEASRTAASAP